MTDARAGKVALLRNTKAELADELLALRRRVDRLEQAVAASDRSAAELRRSATKHRNLVENSTQGIIVVDDDWQVLFANPAAGKIFGHDRSDQPLMQRSMLSLIAAHEHPRLAEISQMARRGTEPAASYEIEATGLDGAAIWLRFMPRVVCWDGAPALQAAIVEITKRKRMEQRLRESEQRLMAVMDYVPAGLFLKDLDAR